MGKKHFSDDTPGRRGRGPQGRPTDSGRAEGPRKFSGPGHSRDERAGSGAPRFGGGSEENRRGFNADRPSFGRPSGGSFDGPRKSGSGGFGGPKKFGQSGGGFSPRGGSSRPGGYGQPRFGGDDRRGFRPDQRRDDRRDERPREERPVRPFEPKETWGGQPYRQEGKAAVPRGLPGERNRKFIKQDPRGPKESTDFRPTPPAPEREPRQISGEREVRPARQFDYRGRPENLDTDRPERRSESAPREESDRRPGGYGQREAVNDRDRKPGGFGARRETGFGGGSFGEKRTSRPGSFGADKREARPYGDRPERTINKRTGRDADSNQAGKRKYGEVAGEAPDYKNLKYYEEDKSRGNKRRRDEEPAEELTRLNRYIANAGICSRREADSLIAAGEIRVNGEVVTEMGYKVQPSDTVQYGKTNLNREKLVYVLLNKPKDFITTTEDPEGRRTVMELVANASKERIFPVGRLDRNTTGLLLFTNDGEVAQKLSHPSHKNKKIYQVELDKPLTEEHLRQITEGLQLEDGKAEVDDVAVVAGNPHFVGVELHIGRNRIVRRIFEHLGYDVVTLDRVQYAGLTKKDLPRGKWRFLNEKEVIRLKYFM
ncbi:pseudouridine synthase [Hymenobacter sp. J193]|uniref:pseudouridine synthase n=1 Tax=Hymenobacter sp. J193 TaxID=2898429 RepID=UPI00215199C2|nr:pseudouridine synthase [Hymenobacter sp. J193]MCR5888078.1 pseudouridine synthase [Hymenobacter sp. J193]